MTPNKKKRGVNYEKPCDTDDNDDDDDDDDDGTYP